MSLITLLFVALAMSTDAFAAAIAKGAKMYHPTLLTAAKTGLLFGCIEACTPLLGWLIGRAAVNWMEAWDHWIAFGLLAALGVHMIIQGFQPPDDEEDSQTSLWALLITATATSIDAMAVGVGLAFVQVNILIAAAAIGLATFTMVTIGVLLGRAIGAVAGKKSEILGGLILIAVGTHILLEHLRDHG
ncbi:manganese efflux pump MntP family protein [Gilvimarinus xylanilyticus]|uniref:Putative manganese efflux pump MntP n=1 Tax=Gilvimarinus xylanilyticus TaxID=2944139 RepID=A0A9X2KX63_9GAMM|nr:manganese efflux pump MntP family protein [Gilvimarinus xylanilyticus]MCP8900990.1 manganese efflux pump MntP family protein [Gilvimarinus xylanilyticus]